jgi:hypothetical protein
LAEEGDYLSGTCGDKDFAQRVKAESEQQARAATMVFDGNADTIPPISAANKIGN